MLMKLFGAARKKVRKEDGNATIEFVILFPTMLLVIGIFLDLGYFYYTKSQIQYTVQEVNRLRSIGVIKGDEETEARLAAAIASNFSDEATVNSHVTAGVLYTFVQVPLHDVQILGYFGRVTGDWMVGVGAQQFIENWEVDVNAKYPPPAEGNMTDTGDTIPPSDGGTTEIPLVYY